MPLPTVIIPVYDAFEQLQACLDSLGRHSENADVLIINDASTDPGMIPYLQDWVSQSDRRKLLNNESNRGFVHSVNRGMDAVRDDVVLLNSDTLVTPGWLESLARCLASDKTIATATPWSNNGEIVSFPSLCVAAPVPDNLDQIADVFRSTDQAVYPELPTAVGFCMAINRLALEKLGNFDESTFGLGYGEENDFSMRAIDAGMRNVLCDDAYVAHHGGASFSPLGLKPDESSMQRLLSKHPGYQSAVMEFIRKDPLAGRRMRLKAAIQRQQAAIR